MPFARVGAMPQPANRKSNRRPGRDGGAKAKPQKGITMEDLKQQTRMRLAQEHQQQPSVSGVAQEISQDEQPFRPLSDPMQLNRRAGNFHPHVAQQNAYPNPMVSLGTQGMIMSQPAPYFPLGKKPVQSNQSGSGFENDYRVQPPQTQFHDPKRAIYTESDQQQNHRSNGYFSDLAPRSSNGIHVHEQKHRMASSVSSHESSRNAANTSKNKLPHGLTVHELKAMTHARLQAEAADRHDSDRESRLASPLDFESIPEARDRSFSHDSRRSNPIPLIRGGPANDSISSIPSLVQVQPSGQSGRQPQVSPLPPGFQTLGGSASPGLANIPSRDCRQQYLSDTFDTASVASHNSTVFSEPFGSESGLSLGLVSNDRDSNSINRGRCNTTGHLPPYTSDTEHPPASLIVSPSRVNVSFDAAVGGIRRRAYTLSPRSQPGRIYEDRPHFAEEHALDFSSGIASGLRNPPAAAHRNSDSPVLQLGVDLGNGLLVGDSRASPMLSFPLMPSDDPMGRHRANTFSGFSQPVNAMRSRTFTDSMPDTLHEGLAPFSVPIEREGHDILREGPATNTPPGFTSYHPAPSEFPRATFHPTANDSGYWNYTDPNPYAQPSNVGEMRPTMGSVLKLSGSLPQQSVRPTNNGHHRPSSSSSVFSGDFLSPSFTGKQQGETPP